jgi:NAD(P)-dependent dehydrogenase (short-subunit alcohol dehydrogenase family)
MPTALITGASRGLGLEFTRQYAAAGWDVIACARDPARATELEAVRKRAGGLVSVEMLDVTNPQHLEWVVGKYANTAVDLLINNAGANPHRRGLRGPRRAQRTEENVVRVEHHGLEHRGRLPGVRLLLEQSGAEQVRDDAGRCGA